MFSHRNLNSWNTNNSLNVQNTTLAKAAVAKVFFDGISDLFQSNTFVLKNQILQAQHQLSWNQEAINFYKLLYDKLLAITQHVFTDATLNSDIHSKSIPIDIKQFHQLGFFIKETFKK